MGEEDGFDRIEKVPGFGEGLRGLGPGTASRESGMDYFSALSATEQLGLSLAELVIQIRCDHRSQSNTIPKPGETGNGSYRYIHAAPIPTTTASASHSLPIISPRFCLPSPKQSFY